MFMYLEEEREEQARLDKEAATLVLSDNSLSIYHFNGGDI